MRMEDVNRLIATLIFLLVFVFCHAQGWERTYGNSQSEAASEVIQLPDGGFIVVGTTTTIGLPTNQSDVLLIRTDPDGRQEWTTTFGETTANEVAYSVQQDGSRGYIIGGTITENEVEKGLLIRTDILGNELWRQTTEFTGVKGQEAIAISDGDTFWLGVMPMR